MFAKKGKPAEAPGRLAQVTIMQFAEKLTDREAAEAVRSRIDWKYALGLELEDAGFDFSVLSKFRKRLLDNDAEARLFDRMVACLQQKGLLKAGGKQRTDSTHIVAAVKRLNRLELVTEAMRTALDALAIAHPEWVKSKAPKEWYVRYGHPIDGYRLPRDEKKLERLGLTVATDGLQLLDWLKTEVDVNWLLKMPAIETLQTVWQQQFIKEGETLRWLGVKEQPSGIDRIMSPHDDEAREAVKRSTGWMGYKVHLTETKASQNCSQPLRHDLPQNGMPM